MAVEIDLDLLNELFENQKRLDTNSTLDDSAVFDEQFLFEDEPEFDASLIIGAHEKNKDLHDDPFGVMDFDSSANLSFNYDDELIDQKERSVASIVLPVILEIIAISCGYLYFS